jgi:hypothetical protein
MASLSRAPHALGSISLAAALLCAAAARADHDRVPDPAPRSTGVMLSAYPRLDRAVTVSGLSSGGFFAHQFHVAFSRVVQGAAIIAGGPYGCVERIPNPYWPFAPLDRVSAAVVACTHYYGNRFYGLRPARPRVEDSLAVIEAARRRAIIDDPDNLVDDRVWLFAGSKDEIVPGDIVGILKALYEALGVRQVRLEPADALPAANHGMPVAAFTGESRFPKRRCDEHRPPYLIECAFDAAGRLLAYLHGGALQQAEDAHRGGTLIAFDQGEFLDGDGGSMSRVGYVYVPTACANSAPCRLHVAFHGCRQNVDSQGPNRVHDDFIRDAGYNPWAAGNSIVVLYPQATESGANPNGCWDFWGYSGSDYYGRTGRQMRAVKAMIDRLLGAPN